MKCEEHVSLELPTVIAEYEGIFQTLKEQVDFYKLEHDDLKEKIRQLVNENKSLSKNLEEILHSKIDEFNATNEQIGIDVAGNLKNQLAIVLQEKDTMHDLWQNALRTVDHLEMELKIYQGSDQGYISKATLEQEKQKQSLEFKKLQNKLTKTIDELKERNEKLLGNLEQSSDELSKALEAHRALLHEIQAKDVEIAELKDRLENGLQTCHHLQQDLQNKEEVVKNLLVSDQESKAKVLESVILVEAALAERNVAFSRELKAQDDVKELSNALAQLIQEADAKISNEVDVIKKQYNANLTKLLDDTKLLREQLNDKAGELRRITRECEMLEEEVSRRKQQGNGAVLDDSNMSKLLALEKNLESSFQKLLLSERRNMQISAESDGLRIDMEQMAAAQERDRKTAETERLGLERKIKTLQNELAISTGFVEEYVVQIKELNAQMTDMETDMKHKLEQKDRKYEQVLAEKISRLVEKNESVQSEMQRHLESEHDLNTRWQSETREITGKFQARIRELKHKNAELRGIIDSYQCATAV